MRDEKNLKKSRGDLSINYTPDIEKVPFSDLEACNILSVNKDMFIHGLKLGIIKRSVLIHYRGEDFFSFIGLFDLLDYFLRKQFFFLLYGNEPNISELISGLVDEIVLLMDLKHSEINGNILVGDMATPLEKFCQDYQDIWGKYWLCNGEKFSAKKCANITLDSWVYIFNKAMLTSGLHEEEIILR